MTRSSDNLIPSDGGHSAAEKRDDNVLNLPAGGRGEICGPQQVNFVSASSIPPAIRPIQLELFPGRACSCGEKAVTDRASLPIPGRKRPIRHVVAISQELFETSLVSDREARRTILYDASPGFVLHRLAVRFGLPAFRNGPKAAFASVAAGQRKALTDFARRDRELRRPGSDGKRSHFRRRLGR
jgi:hypothetical protein